MNRALNEARTSFQESKKKAEPVDFGWYPYDTFGILDVLTRHLPVASLIDRIRELPIADLGGADGGASFFFESLGFEVDFIDYPRTNFNAMKGVRAIKLVAGSKVRIFEIDLDSQFELPRAKYGLVLFLGLLYHLRNPYYALERLSMYTASCLISTRVAKLTPDRKTDISGYSLAYLLDVGESNNDPTNYWIMTDVCFKRLLKRTGWRVVDYFVHPSSSGVSDAATNEGDERAFALIETRRDGSGPKIEAWGPRSMIVGQIPNVQPDGHLGLWIRIAGEQPLGHVQIQFDGIPRATAVQERLFTTGIPPDLLTRPGKYEITIKQSSTGETLPVGTFVINPRQ